VQALVYLAACAPDAGEPLGAFFAQYPSLLGTALVPDAAGVVSIDRAKFRAVFAQDVEATTARVLAAAQKPSCGGSLEQPLANAAWKTLPAW
jgi:hypothetical protein